MTLPNLRKAADFLREMKRDQLAEDCSRAADEIEKLERDLAAAQEELERVRDKCNEHYMALAVAQEAPDAKDARIKELEGVLRGVIAVKEENGNLSRMADAINRAREALK